MRRLTFANSGLLQVLWIGTLLPLHAEPPVALREARDGSLVLTIEATASQPNHSQIYVDSRGWARGILAAKREPMGMVRPMGMQAVRLLANGREVDRTLTDPMGRFNVRTRGPGRYEIRLMVDTSLVEVGVDEEQDGIVWASNIRALARPSSGTRTRAYPSTSATGHGSLAALAGPELLPAAVNAESRIGTASNGNDDVLLDSDGRFVHTAGSDQRHHAANDEVFLDVDGGFRGIVTSIHPGGKRAPLAGSLVLLVREGKLHHRTFSSGNGSFAFHGVTPGSYTVVAESPSALSDHEQSAATKSRSIALQRLIVRPFEAILEPKSVFEESTSAPVRILVAFESPVRPLPVLHLSPAPAEDVAWLLSELGRSPGSKDQSRPNVPGLGGLGTMIGASVEPGLDIRAAHSLLLPATPPKAQTRAKLRN